jgi:spore maturation protein CgeB
MIAAGWSPSVRLFEAAACGVPIVSDSWPGLEELLAPGREILIANGAADVVRHLQEIGAEERARVAAAARARVLGAHTAAHRAAEFECYVLTTDIGQARLWAEA